MGLGLVGIESEIAALLVHILIIFSQSKVPGRPDIIRVVDEPVDPAACDLRDRQLEAPDIGVVIARRPVVVDRGVDVLIVHPSRLLGDILVVPGQTDMEHVRKALLVPQLVGNGLLETHVRIAHVRHQAIGFPLEPEAIGRRWLRQKMTVVEIEFGVFRDRM